MPDTSNTLSASLSLRCELPTLLAEGETEAHWGREAKPLADGLQATLTKSPQARPVVCSELPEVA